MRACVRVRACLSVRVCVGVRERLCVCDCPYESARACMRVCTCVSACCVIFSTSVRAYVRMCEYVRGLVRVFECLCL